MVSPSVLVNSVAEPELAGAGTFWPEPEPVRRSGSGVDKNSSGHQEPQAADPDGISRYPYLLKKILK